VGKRQGPDWKLLERIALIIEMVISILDRFKLL
jgi:hypothetical protein